MGTAPTYMGLGNQAVGQWGNTLNMSYQNQLDRFKAQQSASSGWGSALDLIGGIAGKAFGLANGGAIPDPSAAPPQGALPDPREVGAIPERMSPSAGAQRDDVPANLNVGEFVIPEDVVSWYGEKHMYSLIDKAAKERQDAQQQTGAIPDTSRPQQGAPVMQSA